MSTPTISAALNGPGTEQARITHKKVFHMTFDEYRTIEEAITVKHFIEGRTAIDRPRYPREQVLAEIVAEWLRGKASELRSPKP